MTDRYDEAPAGELAFLPELMAGETLFSWAARYHRLSGHVSPRATNAILFGRREVRLRHDFPAGLSWLCDRTGNRIGKPADVAGERTTLGFFLPFLSESHAREAIDGLSSGRISRLNYLLGHANSGLGNHYPLKACPVCIDRERRSRHFPTWCVEHQWPSVWVCPEHGSLLQMVDRPKGASLYDDWLLPDDIADRKWWTPPIPQMVGIEVLLRLAKMSAEILGRPGLRFDPDVLRMTYLDGAAERSWLDPGGALRLAEMRTSFKAEHDALSCLPGWGFISGISQANGGVLGRLMHRYPGRRHPVVHLIFISFLFGSAERFFKTYDRVQSRMQSASNYGVGDEWRNPRRDQLGKLVREEGHSLNQAAKVLGICVGQAVRWAKKDDLPYVPRPRVLTEDKERDLQDKLMSGTSRDAIVQELGLRRGYLKDYLAAHPDLKKKWQAQEHVHTLERYRQHFLELLKNNPGMPIKLLRQIPGNGYSWLVRHDPEWLREQLPVLAYPGERRHQF